jgi:hypothetical protein
MLSLLPRQKRKDSKKRASTEPGAVHVAIAVHRCASILSITVFAVTMARRMCTLSATCSTTDSMKMSSASGTIASLLTRRGCLQAALGLPPSTEGTRWGSIAQTSDGAPSRCLLQLV